MIVILTAPIRSGKTTSLIQWAAHRDDVQGILTPVVESKRVFMNAASKEQFPMEATGEEETLLVGKFVFSQAGFEKAIQIIRNSIDKKGWLVIDEIGPLELRGEGFHEVLKDVLVLRKENALLVVREGLAEEVRKFYKIGEVVLINSIQEI
jgi:nucleoside-triphosphatase THEP1